MAVETEVRLRSRKGQTTVEPPRTKNKKNRPSRRQRLLAEAHAETKDACEEMFEAAQAQLQQEMLAAGMMGSLPMSFGGSKKRKRSEEADELREEVKAATVHEEEDAKEKRAGNGQRQSEIEWGEEAEADEAGKDRLDAEIENEQVDGEVEERGDADDWVEAKAPQHETTIVDKVRVVYDSDGEVAERLVEKVEITAEVQPEQSVLEIQHKNSMPNDTSSKASEKKKSKYPVPKDVVKFYVQRHVLFYKFEDGIQLDHESWYSVTPQAIAEHIARRLCCDIVVDPFAGCGGNVIQLAKTCKQVIAIDIDPEKIRMAKHNAAIYGVADKIEWIVGNSIEILPRLKADIVFLSPPWGGVKYSRQHFSLNDMVVKGFSGVDLFTMARKVTKNIAYYLPRGTPTHDLESLSPDETVECEKIFLNKQLKVVTAYYGDLAVSNKDANGDSPSDETPVA